MMSSNLDAARLADPPRDPHSHLGADMAAAAYAVLQSAIAAHPVRIAQAAQRAVLNTAGQAIDAALRPCFDLDTGTYPGLVGDLRRPYDPDYGSYNGAAGDPRTPPDDEAGDMIEQIKCAEQVLCMARQALERKPGNRLIARAMMTEAMEFLAVPE